MREPFAFHRLFAFTPGGYGRTVAAEREGAKPFMPGIGKMQREGCGCLRFHPCEEGKADRVEKFDLLRTVCTILVVDAAPPIDLPARILTTLHKFEVGNERAYPVAGRYKAPTGTSTRRRRSSARSSKSPCGALTHGKLLILANRYE